MTTSSAPFHVDGPGLRVLAHPVRARLMAELRGTGPATATALAARLRTNTGATSYHLRKLAEVGLVVDTGEGTGRRRLWAASPGGSPRPEPADDGGDDDDAALDWLARDYVQHFAEKAQDWLDTRADWPGDWQEQVGLEDHLVLVTPAQLAALRGELHDLLERYRRVGAGSPQAKRVSVYTCPLPVDPPRRT